MWLRRTSYIYIYIYTLDDKIGHSKQLHCLYRHVGHLTIEETTQVLQFLSFLAVTLLQTENM